MSAQLIIHILEFSIAFIYIVLIWPIYEGEDYIWGCFICISYLMVIASYCIMRSLLPAMKIACDVYSIPSYSWKQLVLANIPWCAFTLFTFFIFHASLGYIACLPIFSQMAFTYFFRLLNELQSSGMEFG